VGGLVLLFEFEQATKRNEEATRKKERAIFRDILFPLCWSDRTVKWIEDGMWIVTLLMR